MPKYGKIFLKYKKSTRKDGMQSYTYRTAEGKRTSAVQRKNESVMAFTARCHQLDEANDIQQADISCTFGELFADWQARYQQVHLSPADVRVSSWIYGTYLAPHLAAMRVSSITREDISKILSDMTNKGLSKSMISKAKLCVSRPFNWAINQYNWNIQNPVQGLKLYSKKRKISADEEISEDLTDVRVISDEELQRFFAAAAGSKYENYFKLLYLTGLRPSEALGLKLSRIKLSELQIRWKVSIDGPGPLKTKSAYRDIPVTPEIRAVLDDQRRRVPRKCPWLFPSTDGLPSYNAVRCSFQRILAQTGEWKKVDRRWHGELITPPISFSIKDFRHTFATKMASKTPLKILQKLMGHSSITVTMRYYVGYTEDDKKLAEACMSQNFPYNFHTAGKQNAACGNSIPPEESLK